MGRYEGSFVIAQLAASELIAMRAVINLLYTGSIVQHHILFLKAPIVCPRSFYRQILDQGPMF